MLILTVPLWCFGLTLPHLQELRECFEQVLLLNVCSLFEPEELSWQSKQGQIASRLPQNCFNFSDLSARGKQDSWDFIP